MLAASLLLLQEPAQEPESLIGGRPSLTRRRLASGPVTVEMSVELDYEIEVTYEVLP